MSLYKASADRRIDAVFSSLRILDGTEIDCLNPTARPQRYPAFHIEGGARIEKSVNIGGTLCMSPGSVIFGDLDGNLLGDTYVFGNLMIAGMAIADNDIVTPFNLEGEQVIVSNVCASGTVFTDNIQGKTGTTVTLPDIVAGDIYANSIVISGNALTIELDDIMLNSVIANIVVVNKDLIANIATIEDLCVTGQVAVDTIVPKTGANVNILGGVVAGDIYARNLTAGNVVASNITFDGDTVIMGNVAAFNNLNVTESISSNLVVGSTVCVNDVLLANKLAPKSGDFVEIDANIFTYEIFAGNIVVEDINAHHIITTNIRANSIVASMISGNSPIYITDSLLPYRLPDDPFEILKLGDVGKEWDEFHGNYFYGIDACFTGNIYANKILPKYGYIRMCGLVQADDIIANSITVSGNTMSIDLSDIVANTITTNVITILDKVIGDVCITGQVLVDDISSKSGTLTLHGLVQADNIVANSITITGNALNVDINLDQITSNTIISNVITSNTIITQTITSTTIITQDICANGEIQVDYLTPKTGGNITILGNIVVNELFAQYISAICIDYKRVEVNSPSYAISSGDDIIGVKYTTTGTPTITLPLISSLPHNRKKFIIIDEGGKASINGIIISTTAPDKIVGGGNVMLKGDYNSLTVYSDETSEWFII